MKHSRISRFAILPVLVLGFLGLTGCDDNDDITGTGGALATLLVDAPTSAVSGQPFDVAVRVTAVGVTNVQDGLVLATLPPPLAVTAVNASPGTSATFVNAGGGAVVTWDLNTLDSNTQSTLHITTTGTLAAGEPARTVTVLAALTADGISPGDAQAQDAVQLMP